MKFSKYMLIISLVLVCASYGVAKKYSDAPSGQGTSTIGTGGDYASLRECSLDFNTTANTGNWTVTILNDLTEPNNVAFGNPVLSIATVTFKPAVPLTVTFSTTGSPGARAGITGAWVIGATATDTSDINPYLGWTAIGTNNFFIDGSVAGDTNRDLTLVNNPHIANTAIETNGSQPVILTVFGACTNVQVKNCNIINAVVDIPTSNAVPYANVYVTGMHVGSPAANTTLNYPVGTNLVPDGFVLQNCYCLTTGTPNGNPTAFGVGVVLSIYGGGNSIHAQGNDYQTGGEYPTNAQIIGNLIDARGRGIIVTGHKDTLIQGNTIRLHQTTSVIGANPYAIYAYYLPNNGSMTIADNIVDQFVTWGTGGGGAYFNLSASDLASANVATFNVYNNMLSGYSFLSTAATSATLRGIMIAAGATTANRYNIVNNSISIDTQAMIPGALTLGNCYGIGILRTSITTTNIWTIKNNIVRVGHDGGLGLYLGSLVASTTDSGAAAINNNDWFTNSSQLMRVNTTNYANLAAWQAAVPAGVDAASGSIDPTATAPGYWTSVTDLHFTGGSAFPLKSGTADLTPSSLTITTDIDGETRDGSTPWPGADEQYSGGVSVQPVPVELSRFDSE